MQGRYRRAWIQYARSLPRVRFATLGFEIFPLQGTEPRVHFATLGFEILPLQGTEPRVRFATLGFGILHRWCSRVWHDSGMQRFRLRSGSVWLLRWLAFPDSRKAI